MIYLFCVSMNVPIALSTALVSVLYGSKTRSHLRMCIGLYTGTTKPEVCEYYLGGFVKGKSNRTRLLLATDSHGLVSAGMN